MTATPLISIGVPAYNAAAHIGFTLEGLLGQTFGDFELIVSDNASSDGTRDVVEEYRRRDARIRYHRHSVNIGANPNYAALVRFARGQFFKWSSASDWCAPTFLQRCKDEMLAHDDTVLVVPRTRLFEESPEQFQDYAWDVAVMQDRPSARLEHLTSELSLNNAMNGLIRMSALRSTRVMQPYLGADVVLMGELALRGKFRLLEDRLFYRRMDVGTATALQERRAVWAHHYPTLSARTLFQGTKRQFGWLLAAVAAPVSAGERSRALLHVARKCYWDRHVFLEDMRGAWQYLARRTWPD